MTVRTDDWCTRSYTHALCGLAVAVCVTYCTRLHFVGMINHVLATLKRKKISLRDTESGTWSGLDRFAVRSESVSWLAL